jgi:hypothetical protein
VVDGDYPSLGPLSAVTETVGLLDAAAAALVNAFNGVIVDFDINEL